ncbi:nickel transporter [Streptomyces sp. JB150]|uniref:nickel transporter n=1 Tax=Streptomyces sp. JB150 TaxID=2714844 RepID=UPI00140D9697|nr:nickel transporter [Streptomyces sp. JB150]QIJ61821.1 nickel transporter [Streptomyces sp. JB150]
MRPRHLAASAVAACALVLLPAGTAAAHPLGDFTVSQYDGLVAGPGELRVEHVEDFAEIPAAQARPAIERRGLDAWARQRCARAARDSRVTVGGRGVPLTVVTAAGHVRPGRAGLDTLRVECRLTAPLPKDGPVTVGFRGAGAAVGPGWREITARGDGTTLTASDVPEESVSRELTRYPEELLSSPADTTSASLRLRPGGPGLAGEGDRDAPAASVLPRGADRFTSALGSLVARHDLTPGFAALALAVALGLGALHALAPGHGKTLMAATAAARGGRARLRDVLPLAASVTATHTLGVVALGLLVTAGSAAAPSVVAWLGIASGALVTAAGVTLVRRAWRNRGHGHGHEHGHSHGHAHAHSHDDEHERDHDHADEHAHPHPHPHDHPHPHPRPSLRGTLFLGFAGGLVPSPSAVVVLVGAAALGRAWFGLLLVVAYGAGLAVTLTAAGFAVFRLGAGLAARVRRPAGPLARALRRGAPLGSASVVVALGAGLVLKGAATALG